MSERREDTRRRVYLGARIAPGYRLSDTDCLVRNLSASGARIAVSSLVPLPRCFALAIPCRGEARPVESVWRSGEQVGVRFLAEDVRSDPGLLREDLRASRAEIAELRRRLAETELRGRETDGQLH